MFHVVTCMGVAATCGRKFWSGENFGPGDQNSSEIGRPSLFYGTDRNGTEQFRYIISRNGTGSNMCATAHTTAKCRIVR